VSDELIHPEEVSSASLKQLFDEAYMETSIDSDGDVRIKDKYSCFLRPDADGKMVAVYAIFGVNESAQPAAKLEFVNRVNDQVKLIRASVMGDGRFFFDYYISVDGGITKRAVVMVVRRFLSCIEAAMAQDTGNVVA
jgi:hypothetical protein